MAFITWQVSPSSNDYSTAGNWSGGTVPGIFDAASFGTSTMTGLSITSGTNVGEWVFNPGASQYSFTISGSFKDDGFVGAGILVNGGSATISVGALSFLSFFNSSTAGLASIINLGGLYFSEMSTGGNASILNNGLVEFKDDSSAGRATIHTLPGGTLEFVGFATGGNAQLITDGTVDFSESVGLAGDHNLSAGSIEGAGIYELGPNHVAVGSNGLSKTASGLIDDGGLGGGLVKVGHGKLTLSHAFNTYSGGTGLDAGTLDLAAVEAAGTGPISFGGKATLAIENAALSVHVFGSNNIDFFGKHDFLDLTGLKFDPDATATYQKASHHLTVHSGHVTDTLTLLSPHGTHFTTASDGHGGTKVTLDPPHVAIVASEVPHHLDGSAHHLGDYLWVG
jgi:autotransporter-associated beta strand protein